jgi:hypothetical protein
VLSNPAGAQALGLARDTVPLGYVLKSMRRAVGCFCWQKYLGVAKHGQLYIAVALVAQLSNINLLVNVSSETCSV